MSNERSLKDYLSGNGKARMAVVFVMGVLVELLFMAWTASHNIPLMASGTDESFRVFGAVAAIIGEVVVAFTFVLLRQRIAVLGVHCSMLMILLGNSIVRYAQLGNLRPDIKAIVDFYGAMIAPIPVLLGSVAGALIITHIDPIMEAITAHFDREHETARHERALERWALDEQFDEMDKPEVKAAVRASAHQAAKTTGERVAHSFSGNGHSAEKTFAATVETIPNDGKPRQS
jgi:hypothetical protein